MVGFGPPPQTFKEATEQMIPYVEMRDREKKGSDIPPGGYIGLDVFETYSMLTGEAVPLPDDVFNAPGDRRLGFTTKGTTRLRWGRNVARLFAEARGQSRS